MSCGVFCTGSGNVSNEFLSFSFVLGTRLSVLFGAALVTAVFTAVLASEHRKQVTK